MEAVDCLWVLGGVPAMFEDAREVGGSTSGSAGKVGGLRSLVVGFHLIV